MGLFWLIFILISAFALLIDAQYLEHHFSWNFPGFYMLFGFLGCLILSLLAKFIGKPLLQRKEDYYEH